MHAIGLRFTLASLLVCGVAALSMAEENEQSATDSESGLYVDADENWKLVKVNCSSCHSGRLLAQHRLDRAGWLKSIQRMQAEEELWDLGDAQSKVLDYLSTYYGNESKSSTQRVRRAQLVQEGPQEKLTTATETSAEADDAPETENAKEPAKADEP